MATLDAPLAQSGAGERATIPVPRRLVALAGFTLLTIVYRLRRLRDAA